MDAPTQKAIAGIPEADWKRYSDCAVAETLHSMNETKKAFRLIVVKHERQAELLPIKRMVGACLALSGTKAGLPINVIVIGIKVANS